MSEQTQIVPASITPQDYQPDYQTNVRFTNAPFTDGAELLKAYALAKKNYKKLGGISSGKRYAIILDPGTYNLSLLSLILDTSGIDIIGLSSFAKSVIVNSVGSNFSVFKDRTLLRGAVNQGAVIQKAPNIYLANLTIRSDMAPNLGTDRYGRTFTANDTANFYQMLPEITSISANRRTSISVENFISNPEVSNELLFQGLPNNVPGQPSYSRLRFFSIRKVDYASVDGNDNMGIPGCTAEGGCMRFFLPFTTHTDAAGTYSLGYSLNDTGQYTFLNNTTLFGGSVHNRTPSQSIMANYATITNSNSRSTEEAIARSLALGYSWAWWEPMANENANNSFSANKYFFFSIPYSRLFSLTPEELQNIQSLLEIRRTISFCIRFLSQNDSSGPNAITLPITVELICRLKHLPFPPSTSSTGVKYWPRYATNIANGNIINYNFPSYRSQTLSHASSYFPDIFTSTWYYQFYWIRKAAFAPINTKIKAFNCDFVENTPSLTNGINSMRTNYNYSDCSFESCSAGRAGFGGGENNVYGGINLDINSSAENDYYSEFINCRAEANSFGGDMYSLLDSSATSENKVRSAKFINCEGGSYSFGGHGAINNSYFENCKGSISSFGASISNSKFLKCTALSHSFGSNSNRKNALITKSKFENCSATDYSFGYGGKLVDSSFDKCTAGIYSFGDTIENSNFLFCEAKQNSFGGEGVGRPLIQNKLYLWGSRVKNGEGFNSFYFNEEEYTSGRKLASPTLGPWQSPSYFLEDHLSGSIDTFMIGSIHHSAPFAITTPSRNKTYLFELLVYDKKLSFNEVQQVQGYLNNKYSLGFSNAKYGILLEDNLALRIDSSLDNLEIQTVSSVDYIARISDLSNHDRNFIKNPNSFANSTTNFSHTDYLPYLLSMTNATQLKLNVGNQRPIVLDNLRHLINEKPEDFQQILKNEYTIFAIVAFEGDGGSTRIESSERDILYGLNFNVLFNSPNNGGRDPGFYNFSSRYFRFGYAGANGLFLTNNIRNAYVMEYYSEFIRGSRWYISRTNPANCIGKFFKCSALEGSFGGFWAENDTSNLFQRDPNFNFNISGIASGIFEHCSAGNYSFNNANYGRFIDVSAGDYSFGQGNSNNNAMYLGCLGGNKSL